MSDAQAQLPIWKDGSFGADAWVAVSAETELPADPAPILVPLAEFLAEAGRYTARDGDIGVLVGAGEDVHPLVPYLGDLRLIALEFPKFADGRNYSTARLLRERFGYAGELRATGDVLIDQIPLMRRCGIVSFAVKHEPTRRALLAHHSVEVRHYYQPVQSDAEVPAGTRPWARLPAARLPAA
ncbi:phosphoadenosine phosphosulfate reductase [Faunimonas pinastri]|uniref:Phosphoadenosine phosphosulfate reductase n=1 Tax=Faunimonas pinastri TaxID=1855383 RepID=A0A1H9LX15_9HYPH|nr:DUF934 domain-containing protein [Faunimonas pinastri]SER15970.1 phosphoadenosine phosphosulfate reductase [Faunimonas pinastri]